MATDHTGLPTGTRRRLHRLARWLVPLGAAVLTWVLGLLGVAALLTIDPTSIMSLAQLAAIGLLFSPLVHLKPWADGLTARLRAVHRRRRGALVVAIGLLVLVRLPLVAELLAGPISILLLPLRVVPQVLFSARVFYDLHVGEPAGRLLFDVGRVYAEFLWLYVVGTGVVAVVPSGGDGG